MWLQFNFVEYYIRLLAHPDGPYLYFLFDCQTLEHIELEYVPEKVELDGVDEEFRKIFEKFKFSDKAVAEVRIWLTLLIFVMLFICLVAVLLVPVSF